MAQFIQYLYEYENGKKVRNVGFMKVEKQMDKSVIQIYAKQLDEIMGILFQREDGSKYLAAWEACEDDETMCAKESRHQEMTRVRESQHGKEMMQSKESQCREEMMRKEASQCEKEQIHTEKSQSKEQSCEAEENREMPSQGNEMESRNRRQEWSAREMPRIEADEEEDAGTYIPPTSRRCEKIKRQDLSRLPRREWRLANNSFLLHGFYNYHHLLYIEEGDQTWIGVPGIFHEKEKMAANAFGFTKFIRPTDMDIDLSEDEKNTYEDFGYWCRQVTR